MHGEVDVRAVQPQPPSKRLEAGPGGIANMRTGALRVVGERPGHQHGVDQPKKVGSKAVRGYRTYTTISIMGSGGFRSTYL